MRLVRWLVAGVGLLTIPPVVAQTTALARAPSAFADYKGAKVHYKNFGTGSTAVIFVHGWNGATDVWSAQLPVVEGRTRAIFVDLPGWNADYVAYVKRIAPNIQYEVIQGSGHFVMLEHAREFNALLTQFLSDRGLVR